MTGQDRYSVALAVAVVTLLSACSAPPRASVAPARSIETPPVERLALEPAVVYTPALPDPTAPAPAAEPAADRGPGSMRENQGLWELTLQGQGSGTDDFDDNALNGSVSVGYFLFDPFELGVRQIVSLVSIDDRPGKDTRADGSTRLFADLHVPFQYLSPFVGGSFGWVYGDNVKETLAAGLEGGLKWYVKQDAFLLGMIGWDWFFDDGDQIDERFDNGQWVYSIGIGLTF